MNLKFWEQKDKPMETKPKPVVMPGSNPKPVQPIKPVEPEKPALKVQGARKNALKKNLFYISLTNGKTLSTRSEAVYNAAIKLLEGKTPVVYREELNKDDGLFWLIEIKAA